MKKPGAKNCSDTPIKIYSESKFIHETLAQVYEHRMITDIAVSKFRSITPPNIIIADLTNHSKRDVKFYSQFAVLCPTILLVNDSALLTQVTQAVIALHMPLRLCDLIDAIDRQPKNVVHGIAKGVFLNMRTLSLIKVFNCQLVEIKLTRTEFNIIKCLNTARHSGKVITEQEMLKAVFGYNTLVNTNTVKTHMCRLRQKIGKTLIENTKNGYVLCGHIASYKTCANSK